MILSATSRCFRKLPLDAGMQRCVELEFSSVELAFSDEKGDLHPQMSPREFEAVSQICTYKHRTNICAFDFAFEPASLDEETYLQYFTKLCKMAKVMQVVVITVRSASHGMPYNEEVARLQKVTKIALEEGVVASLLPEVGKMSQNVPAVLDFCKNAPGLRVTLDPSQFLYGREKEEDYSPLLPLVMHVQMRDAKSDARQVPVGQGGVEFGKLISELQRLGYKKMISVDILEQSDIDHIAEMRKMKLLLESMV